MEKAFSTPGVELQAAGYSESLVAANRDLWEAMASHPWVKSLADATLPDSAVISWAQQCRLFCIQERRALYVLRSYLPGEELDTIFAALVEDTIREPIELADTLVSLNAPVIDERWPVCQAYSSFVIESAYSGLLEGLVAVFAVERAYLDTWTAVLADVPPGSRWRNWVENWTQDGFRKTVETLGRCLDDLASEPSEQQQARLGPIFRTVARFEHAFWEMAWSHQAWPQTGGNEEN